ncbi:MAG: zinc-ribbon domain-containing protein, partial [Anaerolineae bacterium]
MSFTDKALTCSDCNQGFTFTASEQEFFASKGFTNDPGRCPACRAARKQQRGNGSGS